MKEPTIVRVLRGGHVESVHRVSIVVLDRDGRDLLVAGDPDRPVFLRSAAKPFQAAAVVAAGAADHFALGEEEIAIIAGSHSGEPDHLATVRAILDKLGLDPTALRCGTHPPLDPGADPREVTPLHHNCSGKHAGMLALARQLDQEPATYLDPDGPAQREILNAVATALGVAPSSMPVAVDGCSVPTFAAPLRALARGFLRLDRPEGVTAPWVDALGRVAAAMCAHPRMVAGTGRLDTHLAEATGGALLAKGGAEGVHAVVEREHGLAVALKVEDGAARATGPVLLEALRRTAWSGTVPEPLRSLWRPEIRNHAGHVVGEIVAGMRAA